MNLKKLCSIIIFMSFFLLIYFLWRLSLLALDGKIFGGEFLGNEKRSVSELENNSIVFRTDELKTGKHDLEVYFIPYESVAFKPMPEQINFQLTVQIRYGKMVKEKAFKKIFKKENSRGIFFLFSVPKDFLWCRKADMEITLKDINYDEEFTQYFQEVSFRLHRLQLLGHKINIVDGEPVQRNNGFKSW